MAEFCQRVKHLRETRHLTQEEFAKFLKMTPRAYQLYEQGNGFPTFKRLIEIADYFDVSLDYLVGRSETRERQA